MTPIIPAATPVPGSGITPTVNDVGFAVVPV
jgi:hypothetical protein